MPRVPGVNGEPTRPKYASRIRLRAISGSRWSVSVTCANLPRDNRVSLIIDDTDPARDILGLSLAAPSQALSGPRVAKRAMDRSSRAISIGAALGRAGGANRPAIPDAVVLGG